jgi:hypothetical protein
MKIKSLVKSKKGDVSQILVVMIILLVLAIVGFITLTLSTRVNSFWISSGTLNESSTAITAVEKMQDTAPKTTDYAIFLAFLGMQIGVVISAVRTKFSPLTIVLFIFLTMISIMVAAGMVNMYQGLAQTTSVSDIGESLPLTGFIFSKYFPLIITVISALVMLIMYGKQGGDIIS